MVEYFVDEILYANATYTHSNPRVGVWNYYTESKIEIVDFINKESKETKETKEIKENKETKENEIKNLNEFKVGKHQISTI